LNGRALSSPPSAQVSRRSSCANPQAGPGVPSAIQDDLRDYFDRLDAQQYATSASRGTVGHSAMAPTVPCFSAEEFSRLRSPTKTVTSSAAEEKECAICLASLKTGGDLLELPCEAHHRFHKKCLRGWFKRSVQCPLCRVDVQALLPKASRRSNASRSTSLSSVLCQRTRDGGRVLKFEPNPHPELRRPTYIPPHLHHVAQFLEVEYPGKGVARIWRVPNNRNADLSTAIPVED